MTPATLLETLAARGVKLTTTGDTLVVDAPAAALTDREWQTLTQHKPALLTLLRRRQSRPVVLPPTVHGIPLAAIRTLAAGDWPALAADPPLLDAFTRSALLHGDLAAPDPAPSLWDAWERAAPLTPPGLWTKGKPSKGGRGHG